MHRRHLVQRFSHQVAHLVDARVLLEAPEGSYRLTELDDELGPALEPLWQWAQRWNEGNDTDAHRP